MPVSLGPCWYAHGTRGLSAGCGNVPVQSALRSPALRQKHLRGWMMSWVPFPKMSLLPPPVFTPHVNPLHKSLCQRPMPWTFRTYSCSCSKAHRHQNSSQPCWSCWSFLPLPCCCRKNSKHIMRYGDWRWGLGLPTYGYQLHCCRFLHESGQGHRTHPSRRRRWGGQRPLATDI